MFNIVFFPFSVTACRLNIKNHRAVLANKLFWLPILIGCLHHDVTNSSFYSAPVSCCTMNSLVRSHLKYTPCPLQAIKQHQLADFMIFYTSEGDHMQCGSSTDLSSGTAPSPNWVTDGEYITIHCISGPHAPWSAVLRMFCGKSGHELCKTGHAIIVWKNAYVNCFDACSLRSQLFSRWAAFAPFALNSFIAH